MGTAKVMAGEARAVPFRVQSSSEAVPLNVRHLIATVYLLPTHRRCGSEHAGSRAKRLALQPGDINSTRSINQHPASPVRRLQCNCRPVHVLDAGFRMVGRSTAEMII